MDPRSRAETERSLAVAEKLLTVRDLVGSKWPAERVMEMDLLIDNVDQVLAISDVLLASQCHGQEMRAEPDQNSVVVLHSYGLRP